MNKATNTQSEYLTIIAFPLQQWLNERASMLRYTYTAYLFSVSHLPGRFPLLARVHVRIFFCMSSCIVRYFENCINN